jgi:predicted secreted protein
MRNTIKIIATCAILTGAGGVFSQQPGIAEPSNVVQLSASGSVDVQQDTLSLSLTTTRDGTDPLQVQSQLRQALDIALTEVKKTAQSVAMEVRTGTFSLQPRTNREGKVVAWTGTTELVLEGRDFARIGTAAGRVQTMTIASANFSLSRELRTQVEEQAQQLAVDRFKAKASDLARGFGFSGYRLREVSVSSADQGWNSRPRMVAMEMKSMAADAPVPMEAGKSAVIVNVNGSVQLK